MFTATAEKVNLIFLLLFICGAANVAVTSTLITVSGTAPVPAKTVAGKELLSFLRE